jgi:hypothetical protein
MLRIDMPLNTGEMQMPAYCSSPINRPTKRPELGLSPGARSDPSAKDSVPAQPRHGTAAGHGEGKEPEPSMKSDSINGAVEAHL